MSLEIPVIIRSYDRKRKFNKQNL